MTTNYKIIIISLLSLLVSLIVTGLVKKMAIKLRYGAMPDERRVHKGFIPLMGGLGIFCGFITAILFSVIFIPEIEIRIVSEYIGIILGSLIIIGLGVYDDIKGANAPQKLFIQFVAITIIILFDCRFDIIYLPFGVSLPLGFFAIPFTYLWVLTVNNAVNLLDGLDGLAGGVSLIVAVTFLIIGWQGGDMATVVITLGLIAGIIGFLFYNYHPATIFMGDTGSLFLGFVLAALSLRVFKNQSGQISIIVPLVALAIPIGDTAVSFFRRLNQGKHPFKPDRDHLHHRLLFLGLSHSQAVHIIYLTTILYAFAAYLLATGSSFTGGILLVVVIIASYFALKRMGYLEAKKNRIFYGDNKMITAPNSVAPLVMSRLWHILALLLSDFLMINLAFYLTWYLRFKSNLIFSDRYIELDVIMNLPLIILTAIFWMGLFALNDLYKMRWDVSRFDQVLRISKIITWGVVLLFIVTIDPENLLSAGRITVILYGFILWLFVNTGRMILISFEKRLTIMEYSNHKTLLVGATDKAKKNIKRY